MFKNVVFDFDGVIINSHDNQRKALKESYKQIVGNGEPPYDAFFEQSGNSLSNIFKNLNLPLEMISIYNRISLENIETIKLHEGIQELLDELCYNRISCYLCTGKDRYRTIKILKKLKIKKYFDMINCSDDVQFPKPNPESLSIIANKFNCEKPNMVMVGDAINDILAAKNFGISSIAVTWGDMNVNSLMNYAPTFIAHTVNELKKTILFANE